MIQQAFEVDCQGQKIRGTTYRPDGAMRHPTVLLLHGFTGQRMETGFLFVRLGRALAQQGVAAVTFDFRGCGESDGAFGQMLVSGELADALCMTDWIGRQPFVDRTRLGLFGFSLGGLLAACTVGRCGAYKALALLAPTTVANICRLASESPKVQASGRISYGPHVLCEQFLEDARTLDPVSDVVRNPRPTLLVQGWGDTSVPPTVSQEYADAMKKAGVPLDRLDVPAADHSFSRPNWQEQVIGVTAPWLAKQLRGR